MRILDDSILGVAWNQVKGCKDAPNRHQVGTAVAPRMRQECTRDATGESRMDHVHFDAYVSHLGGDVISNKIVVPTEGWEQISTNM